MKTVKFRYKDATGDYTYEELELPDDAEQFIDTDINGKEIYNHDHLVDKDRRLYQIELVPRVEWLPLTDKYKDFSKNLRQSDWTYLKTPEKLAYKDWPVSS